MRAIFPLAAAALLCAAPASAQSAAPSPLLGSWAVDISRLPIPPEARPKSVTISFSDVGGGKWRTNVDIVAPDGSASHAVSTYTLDGAPAAVTDSPEADMVGMRAPTPDVLVMVLSKGGIPGSTRVYSLTPDRNAMIETAAYFTDDGKPVMRTNYFTRVR